MDKKQKCLLCRLHEECGDALEAPGDVVLMRDALVRIRRAVALALLGEFSGLDVTGECCERYGE